MKHELGECKDELTWIIRNCKGKHCTSSILKLAAAEITYEVQKYSNDKNYGNIVTNTKI